MNDARSVEAFCHFKYLFQLCHIMTVYRAEIFKTKGFKKAYINIFNKCGF